MDLFFKNYSILGQPLSDKPMINDITNMTIFYFFFFCSRQGLLYMTEKCAFEGYLAIISGRFNEQVEIPSLVDSAL